MFKRIIESILVSKFIYTLFVKNAIKDGFIRVNKYWLCVSNQSPYLHSLLFWKIYERREVKLIYKYLNKDIAIIELGASLGLTTTTICSIINNKKGVYSVEANPKIIPNLENTKKRNELYNLHIIAAAIDYSGNKEVDFTLDYRNLASQKGISNNSVLVKTLSLSQIISSNNIGPYNLVCDIEGAEVEMLLMEKDYSTLNNCQLIILEIHETSFNGNHYNVDDISNLVCKTFLMECIDVLDNIRVFKKNHI